MNTIIDLNNLANVNFNNEGSYAISFGTNAGNTTATIDSYFGANITKQTPLNSITNAVRDLLIDVQFSNVGVVSMAYTGPYSNIGVLQIAPAAWRVSGIRSVNQYNEAFANVRYTDLLGSGNTSPEYSYITTVNDQSGNTRTWNTTVDVLQQPAFTISGPLIYNEDTLTPMTQVSVAVDPSSTNVFRFYANTIPTYGSMTDGIVTGNSVSIDGNVTTLNTNLAAGQIKFLPASDYVANTANAINIALQKTGTTLRTGNVNIQIGNTHSEFNFPTSATYTEDTRYSFGNIITDQDTRANSFSISLQQTAGNIGQWYRNSSLVGTANIALEITGSKNSINNSIQWMPPIDYTGNVNIVYNQIKTLPTGNVTQASNVVATFTAISNPEISNMIDRAYTSNVVNSIFANSTPYINDGPDYGQTYTISLSSTLGRFGNSTTTLANTYSYTGNTVQVNNNFGNIVFAPFKGTSSSGTFTYTQSRDGQSQVNQNLNLTGTASAMSSTYSYTSDALYTPNFVELYYGNNVRVIAVGAGGGGGCRDNVPYGGGGGGGGQVSVADFATLPSPGFPSLPTYYSIQIGTGGAGSDGNPVTNGSPGGLSRFGLSTAYEVEALGGRGGVQEGGNIGGSSPAYTGGPYAGNASVIYGGGGAGGGGNGGGATIGTSGVGGAGYTIPGIGTVAVGGGGAGTDRVSGTTSAARGSGGGGRAAATGNAATGVGGAVYVIWS